MDDIAYALEGGRPPAARRNSGRLRGDRVGGGPALLRASPARDAPPRRGRGPAAVEFSPHPVAFDGAHQLREGEEEAAGHVDVLLELAQDRGKLAGVNVIGFQVVVDPDLLDGERPSRPMRGRGPDGCESPRAPQVRELPSDELGQDPDVDGSGVAVHAVRLS
ncbi:hypothetical protein OG381_45855 [Streptomyces sp. NBC_00490]|uniref:hypothetical protein n=1 Tax=Streptomyces sp. NBC_00490 TaxID=2903657 RepID=UPI002E18AFCB